MKKPIIAAFDFDGTITYRDTLFAFLVFSLGFSKTIIYILLEIPSILGFLLGIVPRQKAKERVLTRCFGGRNIEELRRWGEAFAMAKLDAKMRPGAIDTIRGHQKLGHRLVLVSASLDLYVVPWGKRWGFQDVLSTQLATDLEGNVSGSLLGLNCWGEEKVCRFKKAVGDEGWQLLFVYGNSRGDQELLALADHPFYREMNPKSLPSSVRSGTI